MIAQMAVKEYQKYSPKLLLSTIEDEKDTCLRYFAERDAFLKDSKNTPDKFKPLPQTTVGICFPGHYGAPWCPEMLMKATVDLVVKISTDPETGAPMIGFNELQKSVPLASPTATRFLEELNTGVLSTSTAELIEELQQRESGSVGSACVEVQDYREIFNSDGTPRVMRVTLKSSAPRLLKRKNKTPHDLCISECYTLVNKAKKNFFARTSLLFIVCLKKNCRAKKTRICA